MSEEQNSVQAHFLKHSWSHSQAKKKSSEVGTNTEMGQELRKSQAAALSSRVGAKLKPQKHESREVQVCLFRNIFLEL